MAATEIQNSIHKDFIRQTATLVALLVAILALLIFFMTQDDEDWRPLGPYLIQNILDENEEPIAGEPSFDVMLTKEIVVEGTKCRESRNGGVGVQVSGSMAWQRVDPPGFTSAQVTFQPNIQPNGCSTTVFHNQIPGEVVANVCEFQSGSRWRIAGKETPEGIVYDWNEGAVSMPGASIGWETVLFVLTCEG